MTGAERFRRLRIGAIAVGLVVLLVLGAALLVRIGGPGRQPGDATNHAAGGTQAGAPQVDAAASEPDEASAVDAAIAYAGAPQEWLYLADDEVVDAVRAVATPAAAERLSAEVVGEVRVARDSLAESPGPVWWVVRPLAWRVESLADTRATVSVWTVSVLSAADVAMPQGEWAITTLQLEWVDGAWRVAEVADAAGPTPAVGPTDLPWEPEPFAAELEGFTRIGVERSR